jgi:hypothetical protein
VFDEGLRRVDEEDAAAALRARIATAADRIPAPYRWIARWRVLEGCGRAEIHARLTAVRAISSEQARTLTKKANALLREVMEGSEVDGGTLHRRGARWERARRALLAGRAAQGPENPRELHPPGGSGATVG